MSEPQQTEGERSDNFDDWNIWGMIAVAIILAVAWPLLLRGRGAPFEGFHRREIAIIAAGMGAWGAVAWALGFPGVLIR